MYLEKLRNKLRLIYIGVSIVLAVFCGVASATIWDAVPTWIIILCMAIVIIILAVSINVYWNMQFMESVRLLFPVLDRDPDQFIVDFEELTSGKHVRKMAAVTYYNNMGTAYARKKCFREALSYYEKVNTKKLKGALPIAVYWSNVALMHFYLKETDKALSICEEKQTYFGKYPLGTECKNAPGLPCSLARLEATRLVAVGEYEAAETLLKQIRTYTVKQVLLDDLNELEAEMNEKRS